DYTNINRAADDIGVIGTAAVSLFPSICSSSGSSSEQQSTAPNLNSSTNANASSVPTSNRPCSCPIHSCSQRRQISNQNIPQSSNHPSNCSQTVTSSATLPCTPPAVSVSSRTSESITSGFFHRLAGPSPEIPAQSVVYFFVNSYDFDSRFYPHCICKTKLE
ncbi:unnamed protein product, partial [Trichobilharzia regenti]